MTAVLAFSGCGQKPKVTTTLRRYNGDYNGFAVTIEDTKVVTDGLSGMTPDFSMTCRLDNRSNKDSPFELIYGEDKNLDGEWDVIRHATKKKGGYYSLDPADIVEAKELLDKATKTVGRKENLSVSWER